MITTFLLVQCRATARPALSLHLLAANTTVHLPTVLAVCSGALPCPEGTSQTLWSGKYVDASSFVMVGSRNTHPFMPCGAESSQPNRQETK